MALGGCASLTTPDTSPPLTPVPTAWFAVARPAAAVQGQGKTPTPLAQWWQRFNDPLLGTLVTQALQANTSVRRRRPRCSRPARCATCSEPQALCPASTRPARHSAASHGGNDGQQQLQGRPGRQLGARYLRRQAQRPGRQRSRRPGRAAPAWATCRCRSPPRWRWPTSRCAASRRGWQIAHDNLASQQETLQITAWRLQAGLVTSLEAEQAARRQPNKPAPSCPRCKPASPKPATPGGADRPAARCPASAGWPPPQPVPQAAPATWR